jgi:hemoglobin
MTSDAAVSARARFAPGHAAGVTEAMIEDVVHGFYDRVRADPALGPVFDRVIAPEAWPEHLQRMCDFWSSVLLMTGRFKGTPMPAHLAIPEISPALFARWLELFADTVRQACPPAARDLFVAKAEMIARSLQLGIAAGRGELP